MLKFMGFEMTSEHIYSDIYNYDIPVFKINSKDGYSKVILDKLTIPNDFNNINYNCNCIRWIRKIDMNGNPNPYFTTDAPTDEFHLCSLYLPPANYKTRKEIITEINKQLTYVANSLFNDQNNVRNLYLEYRYTGTIDKPFTMTNALPKTISITYPDVNVLGKYSQLINTLNGYGSIHNFTYPFSLTPYRDAELFYSLKLIFNGFLSNINSNLTNATGLKTAYITGNQGMFDQFITDVKAYQTTLENDPSKRNLYNTFSTIVDSYRSNMDNYSYKDGLYEIYNGINDSNIYEKGISDGILVYSSKSINDLVNVCYDPITATNSLPISGIGTVINEFSLAFLNLIYNYISAYRDAIVNETEFKYDSTILIETCAALGIYEIDEPFIENYTHINEISGTYDWATMRTTLVDVARTWMSRLVNQYLIHILFTRAKSNDPNFDDKYGISTTSTQNDSVDWFTNGIIGRLRVLLQTYSEFDAYKSTNWNDLGLGTFVDTFKDRDDGTSDAITNDVNPINYLINRGDLVESIRNVVNHFINTDTTIYDTYEAIIKANQSETVTVSSIKYDHYNSNDVLQGSVDIDATNVSSMNTFVNTNLAKLSFEFRDGHAIGTCVFSRLPSSTSPYLDIIDGTCIGSLFKMTNISSGSLTLTIDSKSLILNSGDYVILSQEDMYSVLKAIGITYDGNKRATTNLTEAMDVIVAMKKEIVYNSSATTASIQVRYTDPLLKDPYFATLNDTSIDAFTTSEDGKSGFVSNIGPLMFIESTSDSLPTVDDYTKVVYNTQSDRYLYIPDLYSYDSNTGIISETESTYKISKYMNEDARISNQYYRRREHHINVASRMGIPHWKTDIDPDVKAFVKTSNYMEIPFTNELVSAYNVFNSDKKLKIHTGTRFSTRINAYVFKLFSNQTFSFVNSPSLIMPPTVLVCAITNSNIEKVISRSDTSNQIYEFEMNYDSDSPQLTFEFSNETKLTIPTNDSMYVYLSASEMPYAIPSGLARLDFNYVK